MARMPEVESGFSPGQIEDVQKAAADCIRRYFKDRPYFCGGKIPVCEIESDLNVKVVRRNIFDERCFDFVHEHCLPLIPVDPDYDEPTIPWSVHNLLLVLEEMRSFHIPKEFQPGMVLLYFKLCMGVDIPSPPLL